MKENNVKSSYMSYIIIIALFLYFAVILLGHCSGKTSMRNPSGYDPSEHGVMRGRD